MSLLSKLAVSIFSNSGMSFGFMLIIQWEGTGFGLQWNNLFSPVSVDDDLTVGYLMLMFLFSSFMYLVITLYVEKVFPGEFGVPEKWYFLFTTSFWTGKSNKIDDVQFHQTKSSSFEDEPEEKHAGIQIRDLRKVYDNKKAAVKGLNLNMFEDQITVLLGEIR